MSKIKNRVKIKGLLLNISLSIVSLIIFILIAEATANLYMSISGKHFGMDSSDNPVVKLSECTLNKKNPLIITYGGSSVRGDYPIEPSEIFPVKLKKYFPEKDIINLGKGGKDSFSIKLCVEGSIATNPKYLVIYAGHNDYIDLDIREPKRNLPSKRFPIILDTSYFLMQHSKAYLVLKKTLAPPRAEELTEEKFTYNKALIADIFAENIQDSIDYANAVNATVILVTPVSNLIWTDNGKSIDLQGKDIPDTLVFLRKIKDEDKTGIRAYSAILERMRRLYRENENVIFIDFESILDEDAIQNDVLIGCNYFGNDRYCDQLHPNEYTHTLIAASIYHAITEFEQTGRSSYGQESYDEIIKLI